MAEGKGKYGAIAFRDTSGADREAPGRVASLAAGKRSDPHYIQKGVFLKPSQTRARKLRRAATARTFPI
jgi:hypothetical protein